MLTKGQIKLIHLAKDRLGLSYEDYKEAIFLYGGAGSSKDLTPEGFFKVMEHFRDLGFSYRGDEAFAQRTKAGLEPGRLVEMVTPAQRAKIKALEAELGWSENPERLMGFIAKRLRIRRISTKAQASKVIEALKAMLAREKGKGTGT